MRKRYCIFLLSAFALGLFANGGGESTEAAAISDNFNNTGYPIVNEEVTMTAAIKTNPTESIKREELWLFKELRERTNVNVTFDAYPDSSWAEKKNLLIASGDLPDMFFGSWTIENRECLAFGLQGVLQPIEDFIPIYNPLLEEILNENPEYRGTITTPEGHIYGYPNITEPVSGRIGAKFLMNDEWLANVGMEAPTTTDELYEVLKAFKENDLNGNGEADEIPLTFTKFGGNDGIVALFGMFGLNIYHDTGIYVKDGDVRFGVIEESYKDAIQYFHKLYSEGLIDIEVFTQSAQIAQSKSRETPRLGAAVAWSTSWLTGTVDNSYSAIKPPAAPGKEAVWPIRTMGGPRPLISVGITSSCESPEILARWADIFYDQEMAIQNDKGPLGIMLKVNDDGQYYIDDSIENPGVEKLKYVPYFSFSPVLRETAEKVYQDPNRESKIALDEVYLPYIVYDKYPTLYMTEEETEIVDELREDFKIYYQEQAAKWIVNGGIEDEWNGYLKQIEAMGIDEMLSSYQSAYDRFLSE